MEGQNKKRKLQYPRQLKIRIAKEVISGLKGIAEASREYDMNPLNVRNWVARYRLEILKKQTQESLISLSMEKPQTPPKENNLKNKIQSLEEENLLLRKKLLESNLQVEALTTLIDLAEENYGIPLRKNSGAKQSND
jgi:transposase-like protein